jgi:two-component system, sensor histidine kinase PdtaS
VSSPANEPWIRQLIADWQIIADMAFSDLVLWMPNRQKLQSVAHARPSTAPTLFYRDLTDSSPRYDWISVVEAAWKNGKPEVPSATTEVEGSNSRIAAYPVFAEGSDKPLAVISRHTNLSHPRYTNRLQINFNDCATQLLEMVSQGTFPMPEAGTGARRGAPRPNDGFIRLDQSGRIVFASPNALSIFNRAGIQGELEGRMLAETVAPSQSNLVQIDEGLPLVLTGKAAWRTDIEFENLAIAARSIPLLDAKKSRTGAIVLCRDVTELRVRERELITKDVTIREIHHRVKNNLQTVASLLRIQSRQSSNPQVKESLAQAMRRVSAIAVVHDVLSEGVEQEISFDQIFKRILLLIPDIAGYHNTVKTEFHGSFGEMQAARSTPLALVLTEVVANAVEHGLGDRSGTIKVTAERKKNSLHIEVTDDGSGLPEGKVGSGLGTQIIRTLVESELRGKISWTSPIRGGTKVAIELPV